MSGDIITMPGAGAEVRIPPSRRGDPVWALATLFPTQGDWTEEDYFQLETRHFIELTDGCIEILPMPTWLHQRIVDPEQQRITVLTLSGAEYVARASPATQRSHARHGVSNRRCQSLMQL